MMEFEDDHEDQEEEEEEEEEDSELAITPTFKKQPPLTTARYRECLKNHAVGIGGHAVDGCGEFMPAGENGSLDALRCAACNCHRNFHRKEFIYENNNQQLTLYTPRAQSGPPHHHPHQIYQFYPYNRTTHLQNRPLALPSPLMANQHHRSNHRDAEENAIVSGGGAMVFSGGSGSGKKRFRTKFTQEQKDKMLSLAEKIEWKIQKQDESVVQQFCEENGVKRHVLKVWMHNNKHTLGKKP